MIHDEQVFDAMEVFRKEFSAWTVVPDKSSEYNDNGYIKYERSWVHDMNRNAQLVPNESVNEVTFERHLLSTDAAKSYCTFRAIKAVMEYARAS